MEADRRCFQSVNVGMASIETGRDRFLRNEMLTPLPHAAWRCNLTALSQRYNLYFMASREGIAVYEPEFPFHKLNRVPKLYIPSTLAEPRAHGYLDSANYGIPGQHPHDINHLVVGDLGSEEILLVSTDSGNVAAYHTKAIFEAVRRDPYRFSPEGRSDLVGLRCFFSHWVQESAWGLAIHKEGRMIAVSANVTTMIQNDDPNAKITVFAFALSLQADDRQEDDQEDPALMDSLETEWHDWDPIFSSDAVPTRDRNYKIVLGGEDGHSTNIPSLSFVNNREDPDGCWLLSCDIDGDSKCWQIWRGKCYATWDFVEAPDNSRRRRQRQTDGGWMISALDPSSFRPTSTMESFCGNKKVSQYHGHLGVGDSYDITSAVRIKTPGRSQRHPLHDEDSEEDDDEAPEPEELAGVWSSEDSDDTADPRDTNALVATDSHSHNLEGNIPSLLGRPPRYETSLEEGDDPEESANSMYNSSVPAVSDPTTVTTREVVGALQSVDQFDLFDVDSDAEDGLESESEDDVDMQILSGSEEDTSSSDSYMSTTSISDQIQRASVEVEIGPPLLTSSPDLSSGDAAIPTPKSSRPTKRPRRLLADSPNQKTIPFIPTLHLSKSHLRMINLPHSRSPHLFCANILKQDLPELFHRTHFSFLQRLNMLQQIPELGIVIVASQLGRAAICSLTKYTPTGTLGLRVDWILPTRRQEKAGARPAQHELLGIAIAPIQGREMPISDPNEEREAREWARDRVVDGVDTTFDEKIVVLSRPRHQAIETTSEEDSPRQKNKRKASKRNKRRSSSANKSSSSSATITERAPWPLKPNQQEDWVAVEGTRRYRLMMTYSNMTVLTYEIGRGVEREDIALTVDGEDIED